MKFIKEVGITELMLRNFAVLYSRYLVSGDFGLVREDMFELAKNGELHSLATILLYDKELNDFPEIKEVVVSLAKTIEEGNPTKPEEFEVVACLHCLDKVSFDGKEISVAELRKELALRFHYLDEARYEYDHRRLSAAVVEKSIEDFKELYEVLKTQKYSECISKAQIGYYNRYLNTQNLFDANSFLKVTGTPDNFFLPSAFMFDGEFLSRYDLCRKIKSSCNKLAKTEDLKLTDAFAFVSNKPYDDYSMKKSNKKILCEIASKPTKENDLGLDIFNSKNNGNYNYL